MGNVIVKEAYLDLLKQGLNMEHLTQFAKNNEEKLDNETRHRMITEELTNLYLKKNHDYGNSFDISLDEDGLLVAKIRLGDKYQRFGSLLKKEQEVEDESRRDTLIDLANYAIMTVMWMDAQEAIVDMSSAYPNSKLIADWYKSSKERGKLIYTDDNLDALNFAINAGDNSIPKSINKIREEHGFAAINAGADLDGDVLHVFTEEELDKLAGTRVLHSNTQPYVGYNIDDILAKKVGLK